MKPNLLHQQCGIYCIRNLATNKVYIGKSKNIYKRIHQHLYDLRNQRKDENPYLQNSWNKYGEEFFEYFVLEFLEENEELVAERELYWMNVYNSLENGYNWRSDSDSKMIVHEITSKKISNRLKKEWSEGIRNNHGEKLAKNWQDNPDRKIQQSKLFSKLKTKYLYKINGQFYNYSQLKEMGYKNVQAEFHRKSTNITIFKGIVIQRVKIEDIVQSSEKSEINWNNYLAQYVDGTLKHKGIFEIIPKQNGKTAYHKNWSMRIVPIALEKYYINNIPVEETIKNHTDIYDFCIAKKFPYPWIGEYTEIINNQAVKTKFKKNIRYYVSTNGSYLWKVNTNDGREEQLTVGFTVTPFNKFEDKENYNINYNYYTNETKKILLTIDDGQYKLPWS